MCTPGVGALRHIDHRDDNHPQKPAAGEQKTFWGAMAGRKRPHHYVMDCGLLLSSVCATTHAAVCHVRDTNIIMGGRSSCAMNDYTYSSMHSNNAPQPRSPSKTPAPLQRLHRKAA